MPGSPGRWRTARPWCSPHTSPPAATRRSTSGSTCRRRGSGTGRGGSGRGCKGRRDYAWAWAATASPQHWMLVRRSLADPSDLAFYYCHVPHGRPATLTALVTVTGKRWPAEECHQQGKGQTGLDQHQVRLWHSFHRHTVLSMCALALLAVAAARPLPSAPLPVTQAAGTVRAATAQPPAWAGTGALP